MVPVILGFLKTPSAALYDVCLLIMLQLINIFLLTHIIFFHDSHDVVFGNIRSLITFLHLSDVLKIYLLVNFIVRPLKNSIVRQIKMIIHRNLCYRLRTCR